MSFSKFTLFLFLGIILFSCKKEEPDTIINIPPGATPYTDEDILFVPYTSQDLIFRDQNDYTLTLQFVERKRTEEYFAWDQTFFRFSTATSLEVEFRLRYLQSDVSKKTLAIYMPYYDSSNNLRSNLFEIPIDTTGIEDGFFADIVTLHDTLVIGDNEFYNVFEFGELVKTDLSKDGPQNFTKLFYNRSYGILQMKQKNGKNWILQL